MPKSDLEKKLLDKSTKSTVKNLKKIIAAGGKLEGVFYFTGNKQGDDAALVVNLMAKDRKGAGAESLGKKLRQSIPQAKYKRGTVKIDESKKLVFMLVKGNASAADMRKTFKDNFAKQAGMAFIKKAIFTGKDVSGNDISAEDAADSDLDAADLTINSIQDLGISPDNMASLVTLMQGDPDLQVFFDDSTRAQALEEQNQEMSSSFLKADQEEDDWNAFIAQEQTKIARLTAAAKSGAPEALEELREAREAYATEQSSGVDISTEVGSQVDSQLQVLLDAGNDRGNQDAIRRHQLVLSVIEALANEQEASANSDREELSIERLDELEGALSTHFESHQQQRA